MQNIQVYKLLSKFYKCTQKIISVMIVITAMNGERLLSVELMIIQLNIAKSITWDYQTDAFPNAYVVTGQWTYISWIVGLYK